MTDLGLVAIAAGIAVCAGLGTGIGEGIAAVSYTHLCFGTKCKNWCESIPT